MSRPFDWAVENNVSADVFLMLTDTRSGSTGDITPVSALMNYRTKMNSPNTK